MANSLSAFLAQNAKKVENKKFVLSDRFVDPETGEPMEWEIQPITAGENQRLRKKCTVNVPVGNKGQYIPQVDIYTYQLRLAAMCTKFPELNNIELQESYKAMDNVELLGKMLTPNELDDYVAVITEHCGYQSESELIEEAKN